MSLTIEDPETVAAIRRLAEESEQSVEDVLREAVRTAEARRVEAARRRAATIALQKELAFYPSTGLKADKAFFDEINGGL